MKKVLISAILFLTATAISFAQPKLEVVGGDTYDWGKVNANTSPVKAELVIKNIGNEELILKEVKKSCGCTATKVDKDRLAPGQTARIAVSMQISGNKRKTKNITLVTNDPQTPRKKVKITADVFENMYYKPRKIFNFRDLEVGKEAVSIISFYNNSGKAVKLSDLKSSNNEVSLSFISDTGKKDSDDASIPNGTKVDIEARVTPTKAGRLNFKATFKTSHPDYKSESISGYGKTKESKIFNN